MKNILLFILCSGIIPGLYAQTSSSSRGPAHVSATVSMNVNVDTGSFKITPSRFADISEGPTVNFELFPDPAAGQLTLRLKNPGPKAIVNLFIYSADGKLMDHIENQQVTAGFEKSISVSRYSPGSYFLKIISPDGKIYKSITFIKD